MPAIQSLQDLRRARDEALQKKRLGAAPGEVQVIVGTGSCSRAVGAHDTLKGILRFIEDEKLSGVAVMEAGCIGMCEYEPIVQIVYEDQSRFVYRNVDAQIAEKIMIQHVQNRQPLTKHLLRN